MYMDDNDTNRLSVYTDLVTRSLHLEKRELPFLISSPLMSCCKSKVKIFGATYSAHAASIDSEMNVDRTGMFMTLGSDLVKQYC